MATRKEKTEYIRKEIISAAQIYRDNLAGKVFLYVFGNSYFEVVFQTDRFFHLTGVNSSLRAQDFYEKAKNSTLTDVQFFFDADHTYKNAKKKLSCLVRLPDITDHLVCVVQDMRTVTLTYKIGLTNLDFTLGLVENIDFNGNKINDWFLPRTLRVQDKAIENSVSSEFIDFIFAKEASENLYRRLYYGDSKNIALPESIKDMLSPELFES